MLIRTAIIGYGRLPSFELNAPSAPTTEERIAYALLHFSTFRDSFRKEGITPDDRLFAVLVKKGEEQREKRVKEERRKRRRRKDLSRL
jgi:peroxisomal coenzyme A diphosphatase NUDT7